jgi:hypothetical protein
MILTVSEPKAEAERSYANLNLTDRQIDLFRQLVARKDELHGQPFFIAARGGDKTGFGIVQLSDSPIFAFGDFYDYVKAGLLAEIGQGVFILPGFGGVAFQGTGVLMTDLRTILDKLYEKHEQLRQRKVEGGDNTPTELLGESDDHQIAIDLIMQLIAAAAELRQELGQLNIHPDLKMHLGSILRGK